MKYMGSKRAMLGNGLGELLGREVPRSRRFVDLFAGSGAVSVHVACRFNIPSLAFDLQAYSAVLAGAVIHRQESLDPNGFFTSWKRRVESLVRKQNAPDASNVTIASVAACRKWCSAQLELPITKAYGGHYFSAKQSVWIDALCAKLPEQEPARSCACSSHSRRKSVCSSSRTYRTAIPTDENIEAVFGRGLEQGCLAEDSERIRINRGSMRAAAGTG